LKYTYNVSSIVYSDGTTVTPDWIVTTAANLKSHFYSKIM
jgi:hypothetical protein